MKSTSEPVESPAITTNKSKATSVIFPNEKYLLLSEIIHRLAQLGAEDTELEWILSKGPDVKMSEIARVEFLCNRRKAKLEGRY